MSRHINTDTFISEHKSSNGTKQEATRLGLSKLDICAQKWSPRSLTQQSLDQMHFVLSTALFNPFMPRVHYS